MQGTKASVVLLACICCLMFVYFWVLCPFLISYWHILFIFLPQMGSLGLVQVLHIFFFVDCIFCSLRYYYMSLFLHINISCNCYPDYQLSLQILSLFVFHIPEQNGCASALLLKSLDLITFIIINTPTSSSAPFIFAFKIILPGVYQV